jgi:hypothetical protein
VAYAQSLCNSENHELGAEIDTTTEYSLTELQPSEFSPVSLANVPHMPGLAPLNAANEPRPNENVRAESSYKIQQTQTQGNLMQDGGRQAAPTLALVSGGASLSNNHQNQWTAFSESNFQHLTHRLLYPGDASSTDFTSNGGMLDIDFFSMPSIDEQYFGVDRVVSDSLFGIGDIKARGNETQGSTVLSPLRQNELPSPASLDSSRPQHPPLLNLGHRLKPAVSILGLDNGSYATILRATQANMPASQRVTLPNLGKLQQFITSYIKCFHSHYPILHLPSVTSKPPYPPLLLAISAIGALYRLNRGTAWQLWKYAHVLMEPVSSPMNPLMHISDE